MGVPAINGIWNGIPDPHSPLGARRIGEIGITRVGAAVANAICNATCKRTQEPMVTLDEFL
jgi:xanthine dehydrogenase YagR molybdenum-binding subunit